MAEKDYFEDLLKDFDDPKEEKEVSEEEQRRKNKDAEEARKRREAEAKAKEEAQAQADGVEEKVDEPVAQKVAEVVEETKVEPVKEQANKVNALGEQLVHFKARYPEVDLPALDKDTNFKKFINGKLLGKQNFIELYEDYIDLTSSISGKSQEELRSNYAIKAKASSGTSKPAGKAEVAPEVYTQEELNSLLKRIPLMGDKQIKQIQEKFDRSVEYYKKNK